MSRKRHGHVERRIDGGTIIAALFVLTLIAAMFWMGITGNRFCCDPKSLVGQLRQQLLVGVSLDAAVAPLSPRPSTVTLLLPTVPEDCDE